MDFIRVSPLEKKGENQNGNTYSFLCERQGEMLFCTRKKGSVSGNHYHEGKSATKDPEILFLLQGEAILLGRYLPTGESRRFHLSAPCRVEVDTMVWHEIEALTDICFIELNSAAEHASDTKYGWPTQLA